MKRTLDNVNLNGKIVIARFDLNVPFENGNISDNTRIRMVIPTIIEIMKTAKNLIIISHLGRIKTEDDKKKLSMKIVYNELKKLLKDETDLEIFFEGHTEYDVIKKTISNLKNKQVLVLENTRFYDVKNGKLVNFESKCNDTLASFYASLADVFVNDAFGTGHRKHASNFGISLHIKNAVIGRLVEKELLAIDPIMHNPKRPLIVILGGAKVSDKLGILNRFLQVADKVIIGGGMAYTFMVAQGKSIGTSLLEKGRVQLAKEMLIKYHDKIVLPIDFLCTSEFSNDTPIHYFENEIPDGMMSLDIGKKTIELFKKILSNAKSILWNGPMGVFEFSNYSKGTLEIAKAIGKLDAYSVIGGGDSVSAINLLDSQKYKFDHISPGGSTCWKEGISKNWYKFSHISTGGGALMTLLEGKELVGFSNIDEQTAK